MTEKINFNKILVVICFVGIFAIAGYFVYSYFQQNRLEESTESTETADWLTYTNNEYGYTIKYPAEWKLWTLADYEVRFYHPDYYLQGPIEGQWFMAYALSHDCKSEYWEQCVFNTIPKEQEDMIQESVFRGEKVYRLSICPLDFINQGYDYCEETIFIINHQKKFVLDFAVSMAPYTGEVDKEKVMKVFDEMLSTLHFTK